MPGRWPRSSRARATGSATASTARYRAACSRPTCTGRAWPAIPEFADLLLSKVVGPLAPLDLPEVDQLRRERLAAPAAGVEPPPVAPRSTLRSRKRERRRSCRRSRRRSARDRPRAARCERTSDCPVLVRSPGPLPSPAGRPSYTPQVPDVLPAIAAVLIAVVLGRQLDSVARPRSRMRNAAMSGVEHRGIQRCGRRSADINWNSSRSHSPSETRFGIDEWQYSSSESTVRPRDATRMSQSISPSTS